MQDSSLNELCQDPTSVRIWHKAVFKVGPVAGPSCIYPTPPEARGDVSSGGKHPTELCGTQSQPVESAPPQDTKERVERAVIYPTPHQRTNMAQGRY